MTSNKEFILFPKENISFIDKFYILMDLLVSNQQTSQTESFLLFGIYYLQIICGFFSPQIGVFDIENSASDKILNYIGRIFRFKALFENSYSDFQIVICVLCGLYLVFTLYFLIKISKINKSSFYTLSESCLNYPIKIFIYILFNITLDLTIANFCFSSTNNNSNPNFSDISCSFTYNTTIGILCVILLLYSIFFIFFIQFFYNDSLYLSNSPFAKISCNYEVYMGLNSIAYSIFLVQAYTLSKEVFLIYNMISSLLFVNFYFRRFLYYNRMTNILCGMFHVLYVWTALFFLIFAYIDFNEKAIIYLVSTIIVLYFYFNLKYKIEENILLATPFYKITNKYYLLYYIKSLIDKINNISKSPEDKAILTGIIQMHGIECPNPNCLTKTKKRIYLPMSNEWSDRTKLLINDKVFLLNFILIVMNFFIEQNYYSPDMIINISLYYLEIIGNYCQSLFFFKKAKEMKLSYQERFTFARLRIAISKSLVAKLKPPNEPCLNLEDLNMTLYFKYADLSQKLYDEMSNDVNFLLEFWKCFKGSQTDSSKSIDFNKIFHLTDKIRITKRKVDVIWKKLFDIYSGVNDLFELFLNYTEFINDDDLLKRDLDEIKKKTENNVEFIQQNYYSILFNKDTGIIIANGDKGKEGMIERANNSIEEIFKYKAEELRGINVAQLMPRLLAQDHKRFMEIYNENGEKKIIDNKDIKTFGKDKNNSLILIRLAVKLFPMINENVFFGAMIVKENIDDIIFIDSKFIIQGMSSKLMKILQIDNNSLFNENDIPFYVICKKFVNFYNIFLRKKTNKGKSRAKASSVIEDNISLASNPGVTLNNNLNEPNKPDSTIIQKNDPCNPREAHDNENEEDDAHENIEINENIELEYEIKVPQFIYDYSTYQNKKEKRIEMNLTRKESTVSNLNNDASMHEESDEYAESDLLVNEDASPTNQKTASNFLVTSSPTTLLRDKKRDDIPMANTNENNQNEANKQPDEERDFKQNIQHEKDLFDNNQFKELEEFIDNSTKDNNITEFKFNFTFDKYKYGDKLNAYLVRCIDNKIDGLKSDEDSIGEELDPKVSKYRKEKNESLKQSYELLVDEKITLLNHYQDFIQLSLDDKAFQKNLIDSKEMIFKMSMIHGHKQENVVEDENSSQTSQSSYKNDLCQKTKIEEIRANIMKNVANFYTLKYIQILLIAIFITTAIFMGCLIGFAFITIVGLSGVLNLNDELFQSTLRMSNLESSLISLRTLYLFRKDDEKSYYDFSFFIQPDSVYYNQMKNYSIQWYDKIITNFGIIESNIGKYINDSVNQFWNNEKISYAFQLDDNEAFPLALSQILSDVNTLLNNEYFTYDKEIIKKITEGQKELINYSSYLAIENAVRHLLPSQFIKIKTLPIELRNYNKNQMTKVILIIVINFVLVFVYNCIYSVLLYLTNQNMGEGLEKVSKIHIEKIEDTIKRIESFYSLLKKQHDKGLKVLGGGNEGNKPNASGDDKQNGNNTGGGNLGFSSEIKKHKKLSILNHSYVHMIVMLVIQAAFLIPLYLLINEMINSTNQLINVDGYMLGKILLAAASTVDVKCMMSQCDITQGLDYKNIISKSDIQSIVQGISIFPELADFYNNKFLLNACDSAFDQVKQTAEHQTCMDDILIQSANNTDSLLKLIEETVDSIIKERDMKIGTNITLPNGTSVLFNTFFLYNTTSFNDLETVFYKYVAPVSDNFSSVAKLSLNNYLNIKLIIIIALGCSLVILVLIQCIYLGVFFIRKLIHLLSVSRCILKIIPTIVINNTPDLANWIENKY